MLTEESKAKRWIDKVNADSELIDGTEKSKYTYVYKEDNVFKFSPNLMKLDIFNFKCLHHTYSLAVNLSNEYDAAGIKAISSTDNTSDKLLRDEKSKTTFKDAIIEYDEIMKRKAATTLTFSFTDNERIALLKSKYPYIDDAYRIIGMDGIKDMNYHTANIQRFLISNSTKLDNIGKVAKLLKTVKGFTEGNFITGKEIKEVLTNIYTTIGITSKASVEDFRQYAIIKDVVRRIDGKNTKGYVIQYIKVR